MSLCTRICTSRPQVSADVVALSRILAGSPRLPRAATFLPGPAAFSALPNVSSLTPGLSGPDCQWLFRELLDAGVSLRISPGPR